MFLLNIFFHSYVKYSDFTYYYIINLLHYIPSTSTISITIIKHNFKTTIMKQNNMRHSSPLTTQIVTMFMGISYHLTTIF